MKQSKIRQENGKELTLISSLNKFTVGILCNPVSSHLKKASVRWTPGINSTANTAYTIEFCLIKIL